MTNKSMLLSDQVENDLTEAIANLELLKKSLKAQQQELAADRQQLEAEMTQVRVAQAQLKSAQSQLEDAKSQLETAQSELSKARAQLETARTHLEAAKAEVGNDKIKLDAAKASLEAAKLKFEAATKQLNAAKTRFEAAKTQLDAATSSMAAEKSELEDEKSKLQIKVSQLESDKSKLETRASQLENDKKKLEAEQIKSRSEIQGLNDKIRELEKQSNGKKSHMIPARQLRIEWSETPQYWTWKSSPDSMHGEVAELLNVCWLEIYGRVQKKDLTPNTNYAAYLVFKLTNNHKGFYSPASEAFVGIMLGERSTRNVMLVMEGQGEHPVWRRDGWMEVELGQYYVTGNNNDNDILEMSLKEIGGGQWKSGLVVQGIEVRPRF